MKKRILLSCIALCCVVFGALAQRSYTFNAAALNVDGLPEKIYGITINEGAPGSAGATTLCNTIANSGWAFCGFSEDFNYHSELTAAPASTYYNFGAHGGSVSGLSNSTDGLGFACSKFFTMTGGTKVAWNTHYGETSDGADGLINKGFRVYTVSLATGVAVDVYVLHMDASDGDMDIAARESQLTQLATYIKNNHNNRPVIILGDTNCRYTREQLKTMFIDVINADSRFTIKDAWVEHMWGGTYPTYGSEAMMTHAYGDQKGEVVDKIFYINTTASNLTLKANSYLHDTSITVSDHYPVVVNFTLTDPNGTPLTDAEKENNWTLEESVAGNKKPIWEGEQVVSGTDYYIMNVGTGEYIKWGGAYYTEAVAGYGGTPITPITSDGGNSWVLKTSRNHVGEGDETYLDQTGTWYLEPVEGTAYQYRLRNSRNLYLSTTPTEAHKPIKSVTGNANDDNQKWVFLTDDRIRTEMVKATGEYPFNFTALLKSADFDVIEYEDGFTANWTNFNQSSGPFMGAGTGWGGDPNAYSTYAYTTKTTSGAATMSQNLGTLPNGTYKISFEGFYRAKYKTSSFGSAKEETVSAVVKFGSAGDIGVKQNKNINVNSDAHSVFKDDSYATSSEIKMSSSQSVTLSVEMPKTTGKSRTEGWICVDNFHLMYYGTGEVAIDPNKEYKDQVLAKVNETYPKVLELNEAGQAAYDITTVISRYNNDQITSAAEAKALCDIVDAAYASAYAAHRAYLVENAFENMGPDGDISMVIVNPSFETGDLTGWTVLVYGNDTRVADNLNASGMDGKYLFNSWADGNYGCGQVLQEIKGLRNGYYTLQAMVTSWADRKVYIVGNNQYTGTYSPSGDGTFVNLALDFLVENGVAQIGAVGGNKDNDFYYKQGIFFKVDNFRLAYKGEVGEGRVKIALADAKAKAEGLSDAAKEQFNAAVAQYENITVIGDGKAEETAIYNALKAATVVQPHANTDMTWLITNPSFETSDWTGWTTTIGWDSRVAHASDGVAPSNGEGYYVVNTWNDDTNATNSGVNAPIYQTLTGLPNGHYRLTIDVASDAGNQVCAYATVGGQTVNGAASPENNWTFVKASVDFTVINGTATIGVVGYRNGEFNISGGCWYKCDNFRLTYVAPITVERVTLSEEMAALVEGETISLTAIVSPDYATDKTVIWSSSNKDIATVNEEGRIVAVAPGTVTITATSGECSATCEVTVIAASYVFTLLVDDEVFFKDTLVRDTPMEVVMDSVIAPTKEGYTFSGWEVPEVMPANDLTLNATFIINKYLVTFKIGDDVIASDSLEYGAAIVVPEVPEKEGYTFSGWGKVVATVPAEDLTYAGAYTVNKYLVTFQIGEDVIASDSLEYGAAIVAPEAPEKEGYTFSGWGEVAATVPAEDVTYNGTYIINKYTVTFQIGDEVISSEEFEYGATIVAPEAPEKEGYTFDGWGEVAATVPAEDVTYEGTYTINMYTITFQIGDEVISSEELEYGAAIVVPEAPEKEGYTFDGWGEVAAIVPAEDVIYEGTYTINTYKVNYYVGEELVYTAEIAYGETIPEYIYEPTTEGDVFVDWVGETYETMPAHDVVYIANIANSINHLLINSKSTIIYDLFGRRVDKAMNGIYLINGKKVFVK